MLSFFLSFLSFCTYLSYLSFLAFLYPFYILFISFIYPFYIMFTIFTIIKGGKDLYRVGNEQSCPRFHRTTGFSSTGETQVKCTTAGHPHPRVHVLEVFFVNFFLWIIFKGGILVDNVVRWPWMANIMGWPRRTCLTQASFKAFFMWTFRTWDHALLVPFDR
jgi:hypothetical protein